MATICAGYPGTLDADGICTSQTPGAAGSLTLDGVLVNSGIALCGNGFGPQVTIYSASNISNRTFTITGTSVDSTTGARTVGDTEAITGPNNTTVTSTKYWEKVTGVSINGSAAGAVTVGVNATAVFAYTALTNGSLYQFRVGGTFGSGTIQMKVYDDQMGEFINIGDALTAAGIFNVELPVGTKVRPSISGATNPNINITYYDINKAK